MGILNPLTIYRGDFRYLRYRRSVACLFSDAVGDFVYIRADKTGDRWTVGKADPEDEAKMPAVGVITQKTSSTEGVIQTLGPCTLFSGLDVTKSAYVLGPSGIQVALPAVGGNGYVLVQQIGFPVSNDVLVLTGDVRMMRKREDLG